MAKDARKACASSEEVTPGVIPHQQGSLQPPFVFKSSSTLARALSGGRVGSGVQVIVGVSVGVFVGLGVTDGQWVGVRVFVGVGVWVGATVLVGNEVTVGGMLAGRGCVAVDGKGCGAVQPADRISAPKTNNRIRGRR